LSGRHFRATLGDGQLQKEFRRNLSAKRKKTGGVRLDRFAICHLLSRVSIPGGGRRDFSARSKTVLCAPTKSVAA
jgi:hypothetical protein